jgi:hypothetical protein
MNENELQYLEKALTNETNENITKQTFKEINKEKNEILNELELPKKTIKELLKKLEDYRYINEFSEVQYGRYFRWINLKNPDKLNLTNGGILCEIKIEDFIVLVLKNNLNRFFQINIDENIIFQRLTDQEKVILYTVDYLNKSTDS